MESTIETANQGDPLAAVNEKRRISSSALFKKGREVVIVHHEEEYVLRITRNGKLILTK